VAGLLFSGFLDNLSIHKEFAGREARFEQELVATSHFQQQYLHRHPAGYTPGNLGDPQPQRREAVFFIASITQTIPSLALFRHSYRPIGSTFFRFSGTSPRVRYPGRWGSPGHHRPGDIFSSTIIRNTYVGLRQLYPRLFDCGAGDGNEPGTGLSPY
jgi:ABC-type proline/glycine betaine transport system permease subunit